MSCKIDYFELPSNAPKQSETFFSKAFGWKLQSYGPGYTELQDGGILGGINSDTDDKSSGPLIGIRSDDIVAAEKAVVGAGGIVTRPIYDFPGGRRF